MELRRSESIGKLTEALAKATLNFKPIKKSTENPFYKSRYADLAGLIEATRPALAAEGLVLMQFTSAQNGSVTVTSLLSHTSNEFIAADLPVPVAKPDAQGIGSAATYARRYTYQSILNLAGDDDDDGNAAVGLAKENGKDSMPKPPTAKKNGNGHSTETPTDSFGRVFWSAAKTSGKTDADVRGFLGFLGFEHTNEVPPSKRQECMEWAQQA